jgi:hypothetical protein
VTRTVRPSVRHLGPHGNTTEPSGEMSVGDVVVIGEAALAVARAGWLPLPGPFTPVRRAEPGTCPVS